MVFHFRLRVCVTLGALIALLGASDAFAASPNLVISQVYGGGGNSGAPYTHDFVELYNRSDTPVSLNGLSIQYASATGTGNLGANSGQLTELPNVMLAGGQYFLVQESGGANGVALPPADVVDDTPIAMAAGAGKVALVTGTTSLGCNGGSTACSAAALARIIDLVGYGNANFFEGSGAAPTLSNTTAALRAAAGSTDTDNNNADFSAGAPTPRNSGNVVDPPDTGPFGACGDPATKIHAIQGSGSTAALTGTRIVEGVVVGDYQGPGQFNGYFVQEETADQDSNPQTSEGIFVFSGSGGTAVDAGDVVRVRGTAGEFFSSGQPLTQLSSVTDVASCGSDASVPATSVSLPVLSVGDFERYEGMLVDLDQELTVTEVFTLARFGEAVLSAGGRLLIPTSQAAPGAPALAIADSNNRRRIVLDDGDNTQNRDPSIYPLGGLSASNTLRVGDTLPSGVGGVLDQRFGLYRLQPVGPIDFDDTNPRPVAPEDVGGNLKVAAYNVLNYFNGDGMGGGFPTARGAETPFELERQQAKIVSALTAIDGDIVGLMEIENDGGPNSALADLVEALNAATAPGTYAAIDTGVIGTDAIKVAVIYKPGSVSPAGDWEIITSATDPRFIDTRNRPSLAQAFEHNSSGQKLTVVVNHLKSKGSACTPDDPDLGDGSGNCNGTRTQAAAALVDWLASDPTGSGDDDVLIIGDLNSYTFETPITTFEDGGYTNLIRAFHGLSAYSFVFGGESGYLDHALSSDSMTAQVTGATEWHINADEPIALDYNTNFKSANHVNTLYSPGPYRSSDHDPLIVGVQLNHAPTADAGGPYSVAEGSSVSVSASGSDADGDALTYAWDLDNSGSFETAGQSVSFSAALIDGPAVRTIRVQVSDGEATTVDEATVNVTNVAPTATFNAPASVFAGFSFTLSLTNATDAAPADVPGLTYAFDCGDGSGYGPFTSSSSATCPTTATGARTVRGTVRDDDGGATEYTATVQVVVTFDSLCELTKVYVDDQDVEESLCDKLAAAKAAAAKGNTKAKQNILGAYIKQVEAQAGKSLTAGEAKILIDLAKQL